MHRLSRAQARRIAVQAQLLDRPRPTDLMDVVRHLTLLQLDPVKAVAPSADLVLWSRLGSSYDRSELVDAINEQRILEHQAMLRPAEDLALYRAEMAQWPGVGELRSWQHGNARWVRANDACRRDILERLRRDGPLPSRALPDTCAEPWASTGWTNDKNVVQLLKLMVQRGEVAAAGRKGRERLWDLAERVYPDVAVPGPEEALRLRNEQRLHALGLAKSSGPQGPTAEPMDVGDIGDIAVVEGVRGEWRLDPSYLDRPFKGRAAVLSPFDRLIHDRTRALALFDFDYQLEMYKPVAERKWGYYALPILYGDRLVGKLDATADHKAGVLRVAAIHQDVPFGKAMAAAVDREIRDLARWLDLDLFRAD